MCNNDCLGGHACYSMDPYLLQCRRPIVVLCALLSCCLSNVSAVSVAFSNFGSRKGTSFTTLTFYASHANDMPETLLTPIIDQHVRPDYDAKCPESAMKPEILFVSASLADSTKGIAFPVMHGP